MASVAGGAGCFSGRYPALIEFVSFLVIGFLFQLLDCADGRLFVPGTVAPVLGPDPVAVPVDHVPLYLVALLHSHARAVLGQGPQIWPLGLLDLISTLLLLMHTGMLTRHNASALQINVDAQHLKACSILQNLRKPPILLYQSQHILPLPHQINLEI